MDEHAQEVERLLKEADALPRSAREAYVIANCRDLAVAESVLTLLSSGSATAEGQSLDSQGLQALIWRPDANAARTLGSKVLDADFEVLGVLGRGGMGLVQLVRSRSTNERFAVKQQLFESEERRRMFFAELQLWLTLPHHPNLTACRFVRTAGDSILIFAEYVEGRSLASWIGSERLGTLASVLDVAIQTAWSLVVLHEMGIVHQDVKPANFLMTSGGQAKLTDFGLARGRAAAGLEDPEAKPGDNAVSCGGMTPAYRSPEQAMHAGAQTMVNVVVPRLRITHSTDLWSWAVGVLEMFEGARRWTDGADARRALDEYLRKEPDGVALPRMPDELAELLAGCLQRDPEDRPQGMEVVVERLRKIHRAASGAGYARELTVCPRREVSSRRDRRTTGMHWDDPHHWLSRALEADGQRGIDLGVGALQSGPGRAQAIADLAAFDRARGILHRLVGIGRLDLRAPLAELCKQVALVHRYLDDHSGVLLRYQQAIGILERLVNQENRRQLGVDLAGAYINMADALRVYGDFGGAVGLCDRAIEICTDRANQTGPRSLVSVLATALKNKASALIIRDPEEAVRLYDRAIEIYEILLNQEGRVDFADALAAAYLNKAVALRRLGAFAQAVMICDRALEMYEARVNREDRSELADELATGYLTKAISLQSLGDLGGAVALYDCAVGIYDRLVNGQSRRDLISDLASACAERGRGLSAAGDLGGAANSYDRAIEMYERLVNEEGRRDLAGDLARVLANKAITLQFGGDLGGAVELYDRAIEIYDRLVSRERRRDLADALAAGYMNKANALQLQSDLVGAEALYDQAIGIFERLVNLEGRRELSGDLAGTYFNKASALQAQGDSAGARAFLDRAIDVYQDLATRSDWKSVAKDLAMAYWKKADVLSERGDGGGAAASYDQAIETLERLVNHEGRPDLIGDLAEIRADKADALGGEEDARPGRATS